MAATSSNGAQPSVLCRFCGSGLDRTFVDLGMSPPCESILTVEQLNHPEVFYPLHVLVCETCFLVQLDEHVKPDDIFTEYGYFSSFSDHWLAHSKAYVESMTDRLRLDEHSLVLELASNDGYLLQYFVERNIPVLGIEPAANVAQAAEDRGVPTLVEFFDQELAATLVTEGRQADLVIGNNVLAQVPNLNSFVSGIRSVLKPDGIVTIEVPHLLRLVEGNQFDTIYHEHFSYFSLSTLCRILEGHGLQLFDVEELWTHGGSLRIYGQRQEAGTWPVSAAVTDLLERERAAGYEGIEGYGGFDEQVRHTKRRLLSFLIEARDRGASVAGYGAPGKGNTLLNYCGIRQDLLDYTVDRNPYKHGRFTPGTHIPIHPPERIYETRPDYVLILPWNLRDEIAQQLAGIAQWGGKLVVPIPEVEVFDPPAATPVDDVLTGEGTAR